MRSKSGLLGLALLCLVGCTSPRQQASPQPEPTKLLYESPFPTSFATPVAATPQQTFTLLCYRAAYIVFPRIALGQPDNFARLWRHPQGQHPGRMLYAFVCMVEHFEPVPEDKDKLVWHQGRLPDGREYVVVEYPTPPLQGCKTVEEVEARAQYSNTILGPYFSAWVAPVTKSRGPGQCYVLGQSPLDGRTTLREVTMAGHYNLGEGPKPTLKLFLKEIQNPQERKALGGNVHSPKYENEVDRRRKQEAKDAGQRL